MPTSPTGHSPREPSRREAALGLSCTLPGTLQIKEELRRFIGNLITNHRNCDDLSRMLLIRNQVSTAIESNAATENSRNRPDSVLSGAICPYPGHPDKFRSWFISYVEIIATD
jgi:hypothetical protein